jgi:hypothetical protein
VAPARVRRGFFSDMHKKWNNNLTSFRPDLSVEQLEQLPRDATGYAQLKILEEQILVARRELDARLEAIMRAKSGFENWMDQELAHARRPRA